MGGAEILLSPVAIDNPACNVYNIQHEQYPLAPRPVPGIETAVFASVWALRAAMWIAKDFDLDFESVLDRWLVSI